MRELTRCSDKQRWDTFVSTSPQGSIFCRTDFLDSLGVGYDLLLLEEQGRALAGAVLLKDAQGRVLAANHPFCLYQGILLGNHLSAAAPHRRCKEGLELLSELLAALAQDHTRLSFCLHHALDDMRAFSWFHYHQREQGMFALSPYYTGLIDLGTTNFDAYVAGIRGCKRREYRLARQAGLNADISDDIPVLEDLYVQTFARQGLHKGAQERALLRAIAGAALAGGYGEVLVARLPGGQAVAATLFLHDGHTGYYLIGANHPDYRNTHAGVLAFLESCRRCRDKGLRFVDVCGINSPNRGDYKIAFNAVPKVYFVAHWQKSRP